MDMLQNLFPITDFLYLLQLEEYDTSRYLRLLRRFFFRRNFQHRGKLIWTKRIKITAFFALPLSITFFPLTPIWIALANLILHYYFENIKFNIQKKAVVFFRKNNEHTKVIAIAGSYGKTTTKNYIYELIKYNYRTQMIPGNINTPTGIANWILESFDSSSEYLIVEVDSYFIGEIKKSLAITPPDIAILTNIGDQHLERFRNKANLKIALEEVFKFSNPDAVKISGKKTSLDYALEVAHILKIPKDIVKDTVNKLNKPDRRGNIKIVNNFELIDQSYNISETTAKTAIDEAINITRLKDKKLIVVTAGIPELGEENKDGNKNLGKYLSKRVDKIILLKSILYTDVLNESKKFLLAKDLNEAWKLIRNYDPQKYMVLMFPELNDLYY